MSNANPKTRSKTKAMIPRQRPTLFEWPLLLQGEDAAACDALVAGIRAAEKPVDTLEEMLVAEWWRWSGRFCGGAAWNLVWCAGVSVTR